MKEEAERYTVFLNPYPDQPFTKCPRCATKMLDRNRVVVVQLGPRVIVPAMVSCRYCANCDLLIVYQNELTQSLHQMLVPEDHHMIGKSMVIVATIDRGRLRGGEIFEATPEEALQAFCPVRGLVHFDRVQDAAGIMHLVEVALPYPEISVAEDFVPEVEDVRDLPQVEETWQFDSLQLRTWVVDENEEAYRPYLLLIVNPTSPFVVFQEMLKAKPSPAEIRDALFKGMNHPLLGAGSPRRPTTIVTQDNNLVAKLAPDMAELGVQCMAGPTDLLHDMLYEFEQYMREEEPPIPGLLDDPRVTAQQVGELFTAAADFYHEMPWDWMLDEDLIAVRFPVTHGEWRFASVMGHVGMEFGLAVFEDLSDYDMLTLVPPEDSIGMMDYRSLTFDDITALPFSDLDAMEEYSWPIADEDAYPIPLIFTRDEEVLRPGPEEIDWYTVALQAIVQFVRDYWPDDIDYVPEPISTTLTVRLAGRRVKVELRYPADFTTD